MSISMPDVRFGDAGLIPAIVQDARTQQVLTLAYMNEASLRKTMETGETWFYSRSRQELWHKGATSGNVQRVVDIAPDCDGDALLVRVHPAGPACHTGAVSCFGEGAGDATESVLLQLEQRVLKRYIERPEGAYTTYLFEKGLDKILKKVGEETAEVIIGAKNRDAAEVQYEVADLLYHLLVLLREQDIPLQSIFGELAARYDKADSR